MSTSLSRASLLSLGAALLSEFETERRAIRLRLFRSLPIAVFVSILIVVLVVPVVVLVKYLGTQGAEYEHNHDRVTNREAPSSNRETTQ